MTGIAFNHTDVEGTVGKFKSRESMQEASGALPQGKPGAVFRILWDQNQTKCFSTIKTYNTVGATQQSESVLFRDKL